MERSSAFRVLDVVATLCTIVAAIVIVAVAIGRWRQPAVRPMPRGLLQSPRSPVTQVTGLETSIGKRHRQGAVPRVALIEFSDFQCPYCGKYARDVYPIVKKEFIDNGRIEYVFRDFPLQGIHPVAFRASLAATCAGEQGQYWSMHDWLFSQQDKLAESGKLGTLDSFLLSAADRIGLTTQTFKNCLSTEDGASIHASQEEGKRLGVMATPTFFVGSITDNQTVKIVQKINGLQSFDVFKQVIDKVLRDSTN